MVNWLLEAFPETQVINDFESTWWGIEKFETNFEWVKLESQELIKLATKRKTLSEAQSSEALKHWALLEDYQQKNLDLLVKN